MPETLLPQAQGCHVAVPSRLCAWLAVLCTLEALAGTAVAWPDVAVRQVARANPAADRAPAGLEQKGRYLSVGFNQGATLSDGTVALSFDRDGAEYLPPVRILVPQTALERFSLRFSLSGETTTVTNIAPPGTTQATFSLVDTSTGASYATEASLNIGALRIRQRSSFDTDGSILSLALSFYNTGSSPITGLSYLRAANPDPDLEHQGLSVTMDDVVATPDGDLAVASGPDSDLTLALGVLDAASSVGFCYRCSDPSIVPYDSAGRLEDWDSQTVGQT